MDGFAVCRAAEDPVVEDRQGIARREPVPCEAPPVLGACLLEGHHSVDHPRATVGEKLLERRRLGELRLVVLERILPLARVQIGLEPVGAAVVERERDPGDEWKPAPDVGVGGDELLAQRPGPMRCLKKEEVY